jgi:hypothetical protein
MQMAKESKDLLIRVEREAQAWERRRPEKKFSGLTVTQFKDAAQASRQARQDIKELETSLQGAKKRQKLADAELADVERRVVLAVRGDEEDGEDSVLYGEMGFTPRSQRTRRGRRRTSDGVKAPIPGPTPVPLAVVPEKVA